MGPDKIKSLSFDVPELDYERALGHSPLGLVKEIVNFNKESSPGAPPERKIKVHYHGGRESDFMKINWPGTKQRHFPSGEGGGLHKH